MVTRTILPAEAKYNVDNAKKTLEADGYKMGKDGYYAKGRQDP